MTYLIDGTNAVRRLYQGSSRVSLAEENEHIESFVEWVGWMAARHRGRSKFRLAFDGPPRALGTPRSEGLDFYFGKEEGADAVLLDQARYLCARGEKVVIVTADVDLAERAMGEGASHLRPEEFAAKLKAGR